MRQYSKYLEKHKFSLAISFILFFITSASVWAETQSYTIEDINDPEILTYPNPLPVNLITKSFIVKSKKHKHVIDISSKNIHNDSVIIENMGNDLIKNPYITGSWGFNFRSMPKLASQIVEGVTTDTEKFIRVHEFFLYHMTRYETGSKSGFNWHNNINSRRLINQMGGCMCGEAVEAMSGLIYFIPPVGSIYARKIQLKAHQTGEVFLNNSWRAFDASFGIRWIYFEEDNMTLGPSFLEMKKDGGALLTRIKPIAGYHIKDFVLNGPCTTVAGPIRIQGTPQDFTFNLRPSESITYNFDMKGRYDSRRSDPSVTWLKNHRNPVGYGSAVFTYKPKFNNELHKKYAIEGKNIKWSSNGIIPKNSKKKSYIVFPAKSIWGIAGADISANFKTSGKVFIGRHPKKEETKYSSSDIIWTELSEKTKEYSDATIEGLMAYWIKFEFIGPDSGLISAKIATEVMMNPMSMPGLRYGKNNLIITADEMGSSSLKITYKYDNQSKYDFYEPATSDYGRHIPYRVGGNKILPLKKTKFFQHVKNDPNGTTPVKVEIYKVSGKGAGKIVRTLKSKRLMRYGEYWWYWDGKNDKGKRCPVGMYSFQVTEGKEKPWGTSLYLFDKIWPIPNEVKNNKIKDTK